MAVLPATHDLHETTVELTVNRDTASFRRAMPGQAVLVVISGPRIGFRVLLDEHRLEIGRASSCGLLLDADSVSRQHARIEPAGKGHRVIDNDSTNGTFVNEVRVSEHVLQDGDRLQIGKVLLKYIAGDNVETAYHEEVQRLTRFDGLTGAYNRSHFDEALRAALASARARSAPLSLITFDLDHFKRVNDTYGHTAGDAVLRQTAAALAKLLDADCLFARVGGEEFAIVCYARGLRAARTLAEMLRQEIANFACSFEGKTIPVTVSLGVAEYDPDLHGSPQALYEQADNALYAAKAAGRNRVG